MATDTEAALLRSLALILAENAGATLQEIAKAAGVSRATLYRFAATREQLLETVTQHTLKATSRIMDTAGLETQPPLQALHQLFASHIEEREFYAFMISRFSPYVKHSTEIGDPDICATFEQRLDAFFQRGQAAGVFRTNIPSRWLTDMFFGSIHALCHSESRGRIARAEMQTLLEGMFLNGAQAHPD